MSEKSRWKRLALGLGLVGLLGSDTPSQQDSNAQQRPKPSIAGKESPPKRRGIEQDESPSSRERTAREPGGGRREDKEPPAESLRELIETIQTLFPGIREMPEGMMTYEFVKTLNKGDHYFFIQNNTLYVYQFEEDATIWEGNDPKSSADDIQLPIHQHTIFKVTRQSEEDGGDLLAESGPTFGLSDDGVSIARGGGIRVEGDQERMRGPYMVESFTTIADVASRLGDYKTFEEMCRHADVVDKMAVGANVHDGRAAIEEIIRRWEEILLHVEEDKDEQGRTRFPLDLAAKRWIQEHKIEAYRSLLKLNKDQTHE